MLSFSAKKSAFERDFDARIDKEGLLASEEFFRKRLGIDDQPGTGASKKLWREIISSGPRDCVSPAISNDKLYLRLNQGVVCYDLIKE